MSDYNQKYCRRTKSFAVDLITLFGSLPKRPEHQATGNQLLRSETSLAANFRATSRARSKKEYYAKLCIVVEECDEALFWLVLLEESNLIDPQHTENHETYLLPI